MKAVAGQIVHLVDVDGAGEEGVEDAARGVGRCARDQPGDACRGDLPLRREHRGDRPRRDQILDKRFVPRHLRETHVLERVTVGPVPDVVDECRGQKRGGIVAVDHGGEAGIVS